MEGLRFFPLGEAHLPLLAALHRASFAVPGPDGQCQLDDVWDRPALTEILTMPGVLGEGIEGNGEPAGFFLAQVVVDTADLLSLGVHKGYRRLGFGQALLRRALGRCAAQGASRLVLEVADDNLAARSLYQAFHFKQVGRRRGYFRRQGGSSVDALVMERELQPKG